MPDTTNAIASECKVTAVNLHGIVFPGRTKGQPLGGGGGGGARARGSSGWKGGMGMGGSWEG